MLFSIERAERLLRRLEKRINMLSQRFSIPYGGASLLDEGYSGFESIVYEIESLGVVARDLRGGYLDFPALRNGRLVYLCWKIGEKGVGCWHALGEDHERRRPIIRKEFLSDSEIYQAIKTEAPLIYEALDDGEFLSVQVDMRGRETSSIEVLMIGRLLVIKWEKLGWSYREEIPLALGYSYSIVEQRMNNGILVIKVKRRRIKRDGSV